jgi:hypothetical protein
VRAFHPERSVLDSARDQQSRSQREHRGSSTTGRLSLSDRRGASSRPLTPPNCLIGLSMTHG